ncbi:glutamate--cysteine ligase [Candidatus Phycosocius spiralis]|uniref:Glutamate--cysteine ligase n=1 Tax=Candidatus Phycosocius spiralis TaxID=2815099 RepID=A0ABQ4PX36_9PROT|nr:glutamate--cysteine ligase [Candidatus Phycosocius spiralis]GIU67490.1 glutamate--cysteine ligase [Candidatus Phycosocius spiralis]
MADLHDPSRPLETFEDLLPYFDAGPKPKSHWKIGTEHEKFGFYKGSNAPVPYGGEQGVGALLDGMKNLSGWDGIYEGGNIIGLKQGLASITLEPGGQFELSGAPLEHLHQTCTEVGAHLADVRTIADRLGIGFLGLGFNPKHSIEEIPLMPKGRYIIMRDYMPKVGRLGRQMMFRSCTVQTNLDFGSEADMVKKFQVALALQPIATALFANSPFGEGRPNGFLSYRAHVWSDTDPDRTGMLPFVFEPGMGFARYAQWALDVPMYFAKRNGIYLDLAGRSFRDFMAGRLPELPGQKPTMKDWEDHLTTCFPEVRLKTFLEMRGADAGPWSRLCALPALFVGLLYDDAATEAALELIREWSAEDRESLRRSVPFLGLRAPIKGRSAQDVAKDVLDIARQGLRARQQFNASGDDETGYLSELDEIAASGQTPAERLLALYHGEWAGDISEVYKQCAY